MIMNDSILNYMILIVFVIIMIVINLTKKK